MNCNITVIPGDGIGPEIVREACGVLDKVGAVYGHTFNYTKILMGGCSIDEYGVPLTDEALETAKKSDSVLLGAVGGNVGNSRWYDVAPNLRPEAGLLAIRKGLGLFANIRPAYLYKELADACPLKKEIIGDGFDMVIMRELTGGLYFGDRYTKEIDGVTTAVDTLTYNENEIRRIAAVKTVPVDFPIPGVEVNKPVEPQVIETVELELYGETYPEPVRVENPKLPKCWPKL